jgi:hypothetical protein
MFLAAKGSLRFRPVFNPDTRHRLEAYATFTPSRGRCGRAELPPGSILRDRSTRRRANVVIYAGWVSRGNLTRKAPVRTEPHLTAACYQHSSLFRPAKPPRSQPSATTTTRRLGGDAKHTEMPKNTCLLPARSFHRVGCMVNCALHLDSPEHAK